MVKNDEKWQGELSHLSKPLSHNTVLCFVLIVFFWTFYVFGSCFRTLAVILFQIFFIILYVHSAAINM